jgi:lysophospholipase L1-like esterase
MRKSTFVALLCVLVISSTAWAQDRQNWVATWGTSPLFALESPPEWMVPPPADAMPRNPPPSPIPPVPQELHDQTLRMIVRTSVGGTALRLQLANAQGLAPVQVGAIHVALHTEGGAIDLASAHNVTFGGKTSITLHPGALMVSDPVDLALAPLTELAVSLYLPESSDTRARHELGLNTTYVASGNVVSAANLQATETNRSYFWLAGIEVAAAPAAASIVAFGDSITDGFSTTADKHQAWPALLAERLQQDSNTQHLGIINMGISGNRILRNAAGSSALTRFDRDVLARSGVSWMILLQGINDINFTALPNAPISEHASAEQIIAGLSQLVDRAHAHGVKVMGATLTPMGGLWLFNDMTESMRQAVNEWIRNSGKFDAVVDFDAVTRDPAKPSQLKAEFNSGDNIHPNDAGNAAMARAIDISVFTR